jgi:hypothetical protein
VIGGIAYAAYVLIRNRRRADRTPGTGDDPIRILEKLHEQDLSTIRERREYLDPQGPPKVLYALQPLNGSPATWMAPAIDVMGPDDDPALAERISRHLNVTHDAGSLAAALREGRDAKKLEVRWSTDAHPIDGPRLLEKAQIGGEQSTDNIVHEV